MSTPLSQYNQALKANQIVPDQYQLAIVEQLDALYKKCMAEYQSRANSLTHKLFSKFQKEEVQTGLYLWGGVGCGKTHLMNMFYDTLPFEEKMRMHFHEFMQLVHEMRRQLGNTDEPMEKIGKQFASQARVICLDEMHINDIADAMIMSRLLEALYAEGVTLVTTSNVPPSKLYRNGEHCEQFEPAIAMMEKNMQLMHIESTTDYRLREMVRTQTYVHPHDARAIDYLNHVYDQVDSEDKSERTLTIFGREVLAEKWKVGIVWFDFSVLCDIPRSQLDYLDIAEHFPTVIVSNIPVMDDDQNDILMRLINLIDVFYDSGTKLYVSAATSVDEIYIGQGLAFEFRRTKSRLTEMQSERYMGKPVPLMVKTE